MSAKWRELSIHKKITFFITSLILVILLFLAFDGWVAKLLLNDFYDILDDNRICNELVIAIDNEISSFQKYMRNTENDQFLQDLNDAMEMSQNLLIVVSEDYERFDEYRFQKVWSINNAYEVYSARRDILIQEAQNGKKTSVDDLYDVYEMQSYLKEYVQELMDITISAGNTAYTNKIPTIILLPTLISLVAIILLITILVLGVIMRRSIVEPVLMLAGAAKRIASDEFFIEDVRVDNKDEIGELAETFNKMKYATGEYIRTIEEKRLTEDRLHEQEREKLEMENQLERMKFDLLRSQINPHFLFNTLNIISGMATLEDSPKTEAMTQALSNIFRYNLKTQDTEVTLIQEIKVITDYMYLQKMRFGDRIDWSINCKVDSERIMIPTFTLQPLLENAIIHGLSEKEDGGRIDISIEEKDGMLYIVVADTGVGMNEEQIKILTGLEENSEYRGMGLGNIIKRIKMLYENGNVLVESTPGTGTEITIIIPITKNNT